MEGQLHSLAHSSSDDVRTCNINLNHWYAVARSTEVQDRSGWHRAVAAGDRSL